MNAARPLPLRFDASRTEIIRFASTEAKASARGLYMGSPEPHYASASRRRQCIAGYWDRAPPSAPSISFRSPPLLFFAPRLKRRAQRPSPPPSQHEHQRYIQSFEPAPCLRDTARRRPAASRKQKPGRRHHCRNPPLPTDRGRWISKLVVVHLNIDTGLTALRPDFRRGACVSTVEMKDVLGRWPHSTISSRHAGSGR
jgi:hypothetical protein